MKSKKFCIKCGEEIPKDSTFCPKCGAKTAETKEDIPNYTPPKVLQNKTRIAVALIITIVVGIAGAYFLLMPHYEWDKYNELIDKANFEIDEGNKILEEYNNKLDYWNSRWDTIQWETSSSYVQENNLKTMIEYDKAIDNLNQLLIEINRHYGNAEIYDKEIKTLNLPNWTYDYIDLRIQSIQKRKQALSKDMEAGKNREIGRDFLIDYIDGQVDGFKFIEEMDKVSTNLNLLNFSSAQINTRNAQRYLNSWIADWNNAYKKIPINSLRSNINSLQCVEGSMDDVIRGMDAMTNSNYIQATNYFEQGTNKLSLCTNTIRSPEDIGIDLSLWIDKNIVPLQNEAIRLYGESDFLEDQSDLIWAENNK